MTVWHIPLSVALFLDIALGVLVYLTNARRTVNRQYLTVSAVIAGWLACLWFILLATTPEDAAFWIRMASITSALVPTAFNLLRLSIKYPDDCWLDGLRRSRLLFALNVAIAVLCMTDSFLHYVELPGTGEPWHVATPISGPGVIVFDVYFVGVLAYLVIQFLLDARHTTGMQRFELQFAFLACAIGILSGVTLAIILPAWTNNWDTAPFAPISVILVNGIIAYGIATRRIMDVAEVLRRGTAYSLLTAYLVALYALTWITAHVALQGFSGPAHTIPHLLAALAVAFSMAPAHGHLQRFANRLFINTQPLDVGSTMQNANRILHSITTLAELLRRFADSIAEAVGTDRVTILLQEKGGFEQKYPAAAGDIQLRLGAEDPIVRAIQRTHEPIVADAIRRLRLASALADAGQRMAALRAAIAVGIHSKRGLEGIMLLGPRLSGRVYGSVEQDTLQILCNQLAVAFENAKLYTVVQDSKIYNDILLDNLVSGVVAANADGIITVFNREAQKITGLDAARVLNQPMNVLPAPLARALELTFSNGRGLRDQEMVLRHAPGEEAPIRLGSSVFRGHEGNVIGALLVFHDITTIKKLEMQVRRTDRLASLGTLAAGMAHEIKNPLVTIKTFTQLLPERYEDTDFRETFSSLIGQEVKRIDSIVNQLLRFSRPTKPTLTPTHLHEVLDSTLKLISEQLRQKRITLVRSYSAARDHVLGDADQLNQAFINFFLNAIESMRSDGHLTVTTEVVQTETFSPSLWRERENSGHVRICIRDTGEGIPADSLAHIFDPFFTTKSHGTGLGLSVAHGIIEEHGGTIDVESEIGRGTTFYVYFPLIRAQEAVA